MNSYPAAVFDELEGDETVGALTRPTIDAQLTGEDLLAAIQEMLTKARRVACVPGRYLWIETSVASNLAKVILMTMTNEGRCEMRECSTEGDTSAKIVGTCAARYEISPEPFRAYTQAHIVAARYTIARGQGMPDKTDPYLDAYDATFVMR